MRKHSLRVNGTSNVSYLNMINKQLEEYVTPKMERNLPGIWGAELDSRPVRSVVWDIEENENCAEVSFDVWDQHNTRFTCFATWDMLQEIPDVHLTIEQYDTVYGD